MAILDDKNIMLIGLKGDKGDRTFIRFSANADGTDFSESPEGKCFIGFAFGETAPTDKSGYTWVALSYAIKVSNSLLGG